jgi:hypothetical protein
LHIVLFLECHTKKDLILQRNAVKSSSLVAGKAVHEKIVKMTKENENYQA